MPTSPGEERPFQHRTGLEIERMMREAQSAIRIHEGYLEDIDNKYRGQPPGPELYAGEVKLISDYHGQVVALRHELDIRAQERADREKQVAGRPAGVANWLREMRADPSTPVYYTWIYHGNRLFAIVTPDGTVDQVLMQVPRNTEGAEKLGPSWVLPANDNAEYERARHAAGWTKR